MPEDTDKSQENELNIQEFMKDGYKTLMEAIKHANNLPQGSDWNFYNTHDGFVKIISKEGAKILKQINTLLKTNNTEGNMLNRCLEEKTELIVEGNDNILEKVAINIDEINGVRKASNAPILIQNVSAELPVNGSWNQVNTATFSVSSTVNTQVNKDPKQVMRLLTAKNIIRPQSFFKDKIINTNNVPWEPRIKEKPNSLKPLAIFLEHSENGEEYSHPYEFELEKFQPPLELLVKEIPIKPLPVDETPLIEITQSEQIDELLNTLLKCTEFAVDLEHHSYRSFMGITCLMQISTRNADYLIDTLSLRDKLHVLNEVFTKPSILKVFHGADNDILWLQRDLSIYVVNMFDTHFGAKQMGYSSLSLAYLMKRFCNFNPNKQFQLADWRIRPLPEELKSYAREDTHYLLYIYQMLKNELIDKANGKSNLVESVFKSSNELCKKRYFKPVLTDDSHMDFYRKCNRLFDNKQLYALKELYHWRDQISRDEDESPGYVLPNHMLLQIAETLPREMQGILACCNPIPPLVRSHLLELHQIVLRAKEQPLHKPILQEFTRGRGTTKTLSKVNVDSPLHCPHDLTKSNEFRDDLQTLLDNNNTELNILTFHINKLEIETEFAKCSVFNTPDVSDAEKLNRVKLIKDKMSNLKFLVPYERYKLVRPFIEAEEKKLAEENEKGQVEDNRTDEERIESIRELYLSLVNTNKEEQNKSLLQIGGTKRKRNMNPPIEDETNETINQGVGYLPISNETIKSNNSNKRKFNDDNESSPNKSKKPKNFYRSKRNRQKKDKNNKTEKNQSDNNQNEEFTPYDYSSVDFRQFQGGAGSASNPQQFKNNYKYKSKNKKLNKNNNKSSTIGAANKRGGKGRNNRGR